MKSLILVLAVIGSGMFAPCSSLRAQSGGNYTIPVVPSDARAGEILYCDLATNTIQGNAAASARAAALVARGYQCGVFISAHNSTLCLGSEVDPVDPNRNVTVIPFSGMDADQLVWVWRSDGSMRPLRDTTVCLTNLGRSAAQRSFNLNPWTGSNSQIWKYDPASTTIANSLTPPVRDQTHVLDRYAEMITWSYNGSYKQGWLTGNEIVNTLDQNSGTINYPVALITNADGTLSDPESIEIERKKIAMNGFGATLGQTLYNRNSSTFPGTVPTGKATTSKRIAFDLDFDDQGRRHLRNWKSTGLYAPPGQDITVQIHNTQQVSFTLRIGPQTDALTTTNDNIIKQKVYKRSPNVSSAIPLSGAASSVTIRSDIGGLIILESDEPEAVVADVTISGAIAAPYFDGTQSQVEWDQVCTNPVPWGEIEGKYCVVSERSELLSRLSVQELGVLRDYYDKLATRLDYLAGHSDKLSKGKHRFVYDPQPTAGGAHAGFPIVVWSWDLVKSSTSELDNWGNAHELGHNYQRSCFSSRFGGEVTNNLYTVYFLEKEFPKRLAPLQDTYAEVISRLDQGTLDFDAENDAFIKLIFLLQIRQLVGWGPYRKVLNAYRTMSEADQNQLCADDGSKLHFFYRKICEFSKVDFTTHFDEWKLPVSAQAKADVAAMKLDKPIYEVSRLTTYRPQRWRKDIIKLQSSVTKRWALSTGKQPEAKSEGGWLESPDVVGTDKDYYGRAQWFLIKNGNTGNYLLQNAVTKRYLFSSGDKVGSTSEGGWLKSPAILGADENYYARAQWTFVKNGNSGTYLLKNVVTDRYLFSAGEEIGSASEGGWLKSPAVLGTDENYYNRATWILHGPGKNLLPD